jgi:hypothetical protein
MWWLFRKPFAEQPKSLSVIMDDNIPFRIDDNYRDTGVREGWLVRIGYYHNENETLVWVYEIR